MQPSSKGTYRGWLLFEKVMQDMRLTLSDRSEQLSIGLTSQGVNVGEVIGQIAPSTKFFYLIISAELWGWVKTSDFQFFFTEISDSEENAALLEEKEALAIQKRQLEQIDESDFNFDRYKVMLKWNM